MNEWNQLLALWPAILGVSGVVGMLVAWLATRGMRKRLNEGQAETIQTYKEQVAAKDALASTLAESHIQQIDRINRDHKEQMGARDALASTLAVTSARQIELLTEERKNSDSRHETVIAEYRANLHTVRNELSARLVEKGNIQAELADLRARTDFKPVMEFLEAGYSENAKVQSELLKLMANIAPLMAAIPPVLERVLESLRMGSDVPREVTVVNDASHRVPVEPPQ